MAEAILATPYIDTYSNPTAQLVRRGIYELLLPTTIYDAFTEYDLIVISANSVSSSTGVPTYVIPRGTMFVATTLYWGLHTSSNTVCRGSITSTTFKVVSLVSYASGVHIRCYNIELSLT